MHVYSYTQLCIDKNGPRLLLSWALLLVEPGPDSVIQGLVLELPDGFMFLFISMSVGQHQHEFCHVLFDRDSINTNLKVAKARSALAHNTGLKPDI